MAIAATDLFKLVSLSYPIATNRGFFVQENRISEEDNTYYQRIYLVNRRGQKRLTGLIRSTIVIRKSVRISNGWLFLVRQLTKQRKSSFSGLTGVARSSFPMKRKA